MSKTLIKIGEYALMMRRVISKPESTSMFLKQLNLELIKIGLNSVLTDQFFLFDKSCFCFAKKTKRPSLQKEPLSEALRCARRARRTAPVAWRPPRRARRAARACN